jgi:putative transposase
MYKAVKATMYPNLSQQEYLAKSFGCARWYYNYALALTNQTYQETGKGLSRAAIQALLPKLKQEHEWLKDPYSQCLQVVALNLSTAFINFFEGRAKFPRFKNKFNKQSITYPQNVKIEGNYIRLPKVDDLIPVKFHNKIEGTVKSVTLAKTPSGEYYASFLVDDGKEEPQVSTDGKAISIDLGLIDFVVTSDGSKYANPKWFKKHERNLKRKQQDLSRKKKGSNNRNKARVKVAKVHEKISRCREDFLHKLSRKIINENQVVVVENLNVKGMVRNHNLAKAISGVGWGMFCTMLAYKAKEKGKAYLEVNRFFPSSKTCNHCLYQIEEMPLDVRSWQCPSCGKTNDRDVNAAKNIRDEGLRMLQTLGTSDKASCPDVRPKGGRKKSTQGQFAGEETPTSITG